MPIYYSYVLEEDRETGFKKQQIVINCIERRDKENNKWFYVKNLHIHHNYYQDEKLPWEYPDDALCTLCWVCHEQLHQNMQITWRDKNGIEIGELTYCNRCFGAGWFPQYSHIQGGICFRCRGARYEELVINEGG